MAKKAKKKKKITQASLENLARQQLGNHNFKEAIQSYKNLLKIEMKQEWREALSDCYQARAIELQNKSMFKEAAILWENRANVVGEELFSSSTSSLILTHYIQCLIQSGAFPKAAGLYLKHEKMIIGTPVGRQLLSHFAAQLLFGDKDCLRIFPPDSPIRRHCDYALAAITAYSSGDDLAVEQALQQIPFRSPFKDFCQIIKALTVVDKAPEKAKELLDRVNAESAFSNFAQQCLPATLQGEVFFNRMAQLPSAGQKLIGCLKGWDKEEIKNLQKALRTAEKNNKSALLHYFLSEKGLFPDELLRKACLFLLPLVRKTAELYKKRFGKISYFQLHRLAVIISEADNDRIMAYQHLSQSLNYMDEEGLSAIEKSAIYKRIAEHEEVTDVSIMDEYSYGYDNEEDGLTYIQALEQSLNYDPLDKSTHIHLITTSLKHSDYTAYQRYVDSAVKQFPKDREILSIAITAAQKKKAYKKAAKFAKQLLKIDPINPQAKLSLIDSHLSHARKQALSGKLTIVKKELAMALSIDPSDTTSHCIINTLQGLVAYVEKDELQTKPLLEAAKALAENPLFAYVILLMEASCLLIPEKVAKKRWVGSFVLPVQKDPTVILSVIKLIRCYYERVSDDFSVSQQLANALLVLKKSVLNAGKGISKLADYHNVCDCFSLLEAYEVLKVFAQQAAKQYPQSPLFSYYRILAKAKGLAYEVTDSDYDKLSNLYEYANEKSDERAKMLIGKFLEKIDLEQMPMGAFPGNPFAGSPFDDVADYDDNDDDGFSPKMIQELMETMGIDSVEELHRILNSVGISDFNEPFFAEPKKKKPKKKASKQKAVPKTRTVPDNREVDQSESNNPQDEWDF